MLNAKVDELVQAVSLLSSKIDEIVDERVRDQVAAAASGISDQVNQVLEEVRSDQARTHQNLEKTNEKLDVLVSRIEAHGKRKKFLGLF
jgi:ABC-type transporter Mla subunit MlaD